MRSSRSYPKYITIYLVVHSDHCPCDRNHSHLLQQWNSKPLFDTSSRNGLFKNNVKIIKNLSFVFNNGSAKRWSPCALLLVHMIVKFGSHSGHARVEAASWMTCWTGHPRGEPVPRTGSWSAAPLRRYALVPQPNLDLQLDLLLLSLSQYSPIYRYTVAEKIINLNYLSLHKFNIYIFSMYEYLKWRWLHFDGFPTGNFNRILKISFMSIEFERPWLYRVFNYTTWE